MSRWTPSCASSTTEAGEPLVVHAFRPSPHPQRVLPPRRGQPYPRPGGARQEAGHGQPGGHRPRQPARGLELLRGGQGPEDQADPRLRGVSRVRPAPGEREAVVGAGGLQPPGPSRPQSHGVQEPGAAHLDRVHRGVLPAPADRQGRARRARRGPRVPGGVSLGRGVPASPTGEVRRGEEERRVVRAHLRLRRVLAGDPAARDPGGAAGGGRDAPTGQGAGRRRGRHQRRALPPEGGRGGARRAARDRHRERPRRSQAIPLHGAGIVREVGEGNAGPVPGPAGGARQHGTGGGALRVRLREEVLPARLPPPRRIRQRRRAARSPRARGRGAPLRHAVATRGRRTIGLRARRHQQGGLRRLLPDRAGLHRGGPRSRHPGGPGPRLGGRVDRRVRARDHQRLPPQVRPPVRAVPQPRAGVHARHRRGLLLRAPGRGDRVRARALRARQRGPDRHLRDHEGTRRGEGRRPGTSDTTQARRTDSPSSFPRVRPTRSRWTRRARRWTSCASW